MAGNQSKKVIYAAHIGNSMIAVNKFFAASVTGSSAMLSEGIHSLVDSGNQLLLLWGIRVSGKAPDQKHPFGYGMEHYFWTFVVAILIFAIGSGISLYEGIKHFSHPEPIKSPQWNYGVLIFGMIFEGWALSVAWKEFNRMRGYHYDSHAQLRSHLTDFPAAYSFSRRLKTLSGLTPHE